LKFVRWLMSHSRASTVAVFSASAKMAAPVLTATPPTAANPSPAGPSTEANVPTLPVLAAKDCATPAISLSSVERNLPISPTACEPSALILNRRPISSAKPIVYTPQFPTLPQSKQRNCPPYGSWFLCSHLSTRG